MGLNTYAEHDILNVHTYEQRDAAGKYQYSAYYEYSVRSDPFPADHADEALRGKHGWLAFIYERKTGKTLQSLSGVADSIGAGRNAAQKQIQKAMAQFNTEKATEQ